MIMCKRLTLFSPEDEEVVSTGKSSDSCLSDVIVRRAFDDFSFQASKLSPRSYLGKQTIGEEIP